MATTKTLIFLFAILAPSTIILAQESNSSSSDVSPTGPPHDDNGPVASSAPGLFPFPFKQPKFDFNWPQIPGVGFFSGESRQKRSAESEDESEFEEDEHTRQKRSIRIVSCNFRSEGRTRCTSCNTIRRCYPSNIATISTCSRFLPYCKDGRCSRVKGPLCHSATATTSGSSSSTTKSSSESSSSGSSSGSDSSTDSSSSDSSKSDSSSESSSSGSSSDSNSSDSTESNSSSS